MKRLLLLGAGQMAGQHVNEFASLADCQIVACADPAPEIAPIFARKHRLARAFGSLEEALAWGEFDAAINATPDGVHKATTLALLAAGKSVFCEKPLAPNYPDALEMTRAAERAGLVNMVNLTYRNSPALQMARRMVDEGAVGTLRHIEASYRQSWLVSRAWGDWRSDPGWLWRLSRRHGSTGVLGDVGIHILDFATYAALDEIAEVRADLATFPKAPDDRIGDYILDANDSFALTARLTGGALAVILATRFATGHANDLSLALHGTKGALRVETNGQASSLMASLGADVENHSWQGVETVPVPRNAELFAQALHCGRNEEPSFRRAAQLQRVIDAAAESAATGVRVAIA